MNIPRDSNGRYVRTISKNLVKIPTNLYGGWNTPTNNSVERYRRTHIGSSSTWKPKEFIGETIDSEEILAGNIKDLIYEEVQEGQPLQILNPPLVQKPNDTTFSLVGDPNFINFIDPAEVGDLFGSSTNIFISHIETSIVVPTIPIELNKNIVDHRKISPTQKMLGCPIIT